MNEPIAVQSTVTGLIKKLKSHSAEIAVIGLGYVGLPLAIALARTGFAVSGYDIDNRKIDSLNKSKSYMRQFKDQQIEEVISSGKLKATADSKTIARSDVIIICVPTPLLPQREPDLRYITETCDMIAKNLQVGHLIVLESTTYPGTTDQIVRPILEKNGKICGHDFFLAYSPEREDPGNTEYTFGRIPKIVGGTCQLSRDLVVALYSEIVPEVIAVSNTRVAEATKLTENIFRSVNIALVNELKTVFAAMNIDIWEVISAAKTKPFGYMPFYPGPGLGGHCIPIDPFYLSWKAREYGVATKFIELAGEINTTMPELVINQLTRSLDQVLGKAISKSRILIIGMAYKKNIDDCRESPGLRILNTLKNMAATVHYYDPYIRSLPETRDYPQLFGLESIEWNPENIKTYDAATIVTDHDQIEYETLVKCSRLIVDTRGALRNTPKHGCKIVQA